MQLCEMIAASVRYRSYLRSSISVSSVMFFTMFSSEQAEGNSKVQSFMLDLISPLLHDADHLSSRVLDALFWNVVEPHKVLLNSVLKHLAY